MIQALGDAEANIQASLLNISNPYDSIGSDYFYVSYISHPSVVHQSHLKEKFRQPKHAFNVKVFAVCVVNFQT